MSGRKRLVVIGNGMAGARLVEELVSRGGGPYEIVIFGDEPCGNYNRILLSGILARSYDPKDIFINPLPWYASNGVTLHAGVRVKKVDLASKQVTGANGLVEAYDTLLMATGSTPFIPPVDGCFANQDTRELKRGAFVFRTLNDCARMLAFMDRARCAAVIGGGLLGLEAARGLLNAGLDVHVIHLMPHLMESQLDSAGATVLQRQLEQMGLHVHLAKKTTAVLGTDDVTGLRFSDGSALDCQMVVIAAGVRPNVELARKAGLTVGRGIVVGDDLACAGHPDVHAIGECAEHRGTLYGLVAPLWEQAQVLAERLSGRNPRAIYAGSRPSTKLKVAGVDLAVMGDKDAVEEDDEVVTYAEPSRGVYKKLVLGDGAIVPSLVRLFGESSVIPANRADLLFRTTAVAPPPTAAVPDTSLI